MTQDIYQLIARAQAEYVRCIDDGDLGQWPEFFTPSCVYRVTTADNHRRGLVGSMIYAASQGMLVDRVESLRDANIYERHAYTTAPRRAAKPRSWSRASCATGPPTCSRPAAIATCTCATKRACGCASAS